MEWEDLPAALDTWPLKCAAPCWALRPVLATTFVSAPVGVYWHLADARAAVYGPTATATDLALVKAAAHRVLDAPPAEEALTAADVASGTWIKLAYAPVLQQPAAEAQSFFPGMPPGIPTTPSPLAAMLTTALIGGGMGYGLGRLGETLLPRHWHRERARRTGTLVGAASGAALALPWLLASAANRHRPDESWPADAPAAAGSNAPPPLTEGLRHDWERFYREQAQPGRYKEAAADFCKAAFADWQTLGEAAGRQATPYDVNMNALGQTLWESGASPALTGTTMGALYAAHQLPDEHSTEDTVTGHQLGQLALNAGKGYLTGKLVGWVLNQAIGMPTTQWGGYGAALGLIGTAVPKLFR